MSSIAFFDLPDIAAGDVLGSCMFNLLIIALLDFMGGATPFSAKAHQGQVLGAGFGILLLGLVAITLAATWVVPSIAWISLSSLIFLGVYLGFSWHGSDLLNHYSSFVCPLSRLTN